MLLEPVTVAFEADHVGVVNDAVDHRRSDGEVPKHVAPTNSGDSMTQRIETAQEGVPR